MSTCTLGTGPFALLEHPGPVMAYLVRGAVIPRWAVEQGIISDPDATPIYAYREPTA